MENVVKFLNQQIHQTENMNYLEKKTDNRDSWASHKYIFVFNCVRMKAFVEQ